MLSKLVRIQRFRQVFTFCNQKPPQGSDVYIVGFEKFKRKSKEQQTTQPKEEKKMEQQQEQNVKEEEKPKQAEEPKKEDMGKQEDKQKTTKERLQEEFQQYQFKKKDQKQQFTNSPKQPFGQGQENTYKYMKYALFGMPAIFIFYRMYEEGENFITFNELQRAYLDKKLVSSIEIQKSKGETIGIAFTKEGRKKFKIANLDFFLQQIDDYQMDKQFEQLIPITFVNQDEVQETTAMISKLMRLAFYGLAFVMLFQLYKQFIKGLDGVTGDMMGGMTKLKSKQFEQKIKIKFKDVAGQDEAKGEIREFVDFLKAPSKYKKLGARIPRGALLTGPPGTGKTLLAKACAGEAGVPFFYVSGSEFVEMYVGLGAARVRELFKQAKAKAPSIVFIDEIDAVGKKRNSKGSRNEERDNTLNQLLVEMDGFGTDTTVVVLAATNMKDSLDAALTRPGRFDRNIDITLPDIGGRKEIFQVHLKPLKLDPSKTIEEYAKRLATLTPGFSGAEIANLCNEAAILAAREGADFVSSKQFEAASERVMAGLEKKRFISEEERKVVAYHESGHAVVSWFLEGGDPLLKLTIIPRSKGSLGYAQYLPNESNLQTREELIDKLCCVLGGRISEEHFFKSITTGASDDLRRAYQYANAIVTKFGMSDAIGNVGYQEEQYAKDFSDKTNQIVDEEIHKIIVECTEKTKRLVQDHEEKIKALAQLLLDKETLDLQQIINLLGERPFAPKSNYKAYLDLKRVEQAEISEIEQKAESLKQEQEDIKAESTEPVESEKPAEQVEEKQEENVKQ